MEPRGTDLGKKKNKKNKKNKKKAKEKKKETESKRISLEKASKPIDVPPVAIAEEKHVGRVMQRQAKGYSLGEVAHAGLNFGSDRGGPLVDGRRKSTFEGNDPSLESFPQIFGNAAKRLTSQSQPKAGPQVGLQENAKPRMINVRSDGLKLDLVLLKNRVSGLTIDYQNISKSGELQRWLRIIDSVLSGSVLSLEGSVPQTLSEPPPLPASQPQPTKEEDEAPLKNEEQEEPPEEIDYRRVILRAVDVGLDTLGRDGKHALLNVLENRYGLREEDILDHPKDFVMLLDELLGPSVQAIEREIVSNIRLVWTAPGESLESVMNSLKEQHREPPETTRDEPSGTTGS